MVRCCWIDTLNVLSLSYEYFSLMNWLYGLMIPPPLPLSNLQLYDHVLPWVQQADHHGHDLSQLAYNEGQVYCEDHRHKRNIFFCLSWSDIESFGHLHIWLLWPNAYAFTFSSPSSESISKSWNNAVKVTWNVPRSTHLYCRTFSCRKVSNPRESKPLVVKLLSWLCLVTVGQKQQEIFSLWGKPLVTVPGIILTGK